MIQITMSMEEYKDLEQKAEKLQTIKRHARNILTEHTKNDWAKANDLEDTLSREESIKLLAVILEN